MRAGCGFPRETGTIGSRRPQGRGQRSRSESVAPTSAEHCGAAAGTVTRGKSDRGSGGAGGDASDVRHTPLIAAHRTPGRCVCRFAAMSIAGRCAATGVGFYRSFLRPLRASGGATCRFTPSCSEYARQAFQTWGLFRGGWLALRRIARCQPWGGFGEDPVPERAQPTELGTHVDTDPLMAQPLEPRSSHVCL